MQIPLWVTVGVIEMLILEALLAVSRRVGREAEPADARLGLSRWAAVAGWATLRAAMLVPAVVLLLALPQFLAL